jgi:deoxyribodipyrimidine photo-lyase
MTAYSTSMTLALHWFRTDLRLGDNTSLLAAQQSGLPVVALYVATPEQWRLHDDAPIKLDFWRRNLASLEQALHAVGIPLLCAEVPSYQQIPALFAQLLPALKIAEVHCNAEYPLNERRRDDAVAVVCQQLGIRMRQHGDQVLVEPATLLNKSGQPFKVFTPYARAARERLPTAFTTRDCQPQPLLQLSTLLQLPGLPQITALAALTFPGGNATTTDLWPAGEQHAQQRLTQFCQQRIQHYQQQRDFPASDGTSALSPYLAAGALSIRQCWQAAQAWQDGAGVFTWQNELLWRDFYKYVMWHYPHVCQRQSWRNDVGHVPWRQDPHEFARWCEARTGFPLIDAAMRQLLQTGWMHNRLRMVVAMFLTKHLLMDWRWGERWFMQHLIDGDFAANNGGWQWSASTGTDAVPYFRIFNPISQSQRFDAEGSFIRHYLPELTALDKLSIHAPGLLRPPSYALPMLDLAMGRERALLAFKRHEQRSP